jgi:hypothetical protein
LCAAGCGTAIVIGVNILGKYLRLRAEFHQRSYTSREWPIQAFLWLEWGSSRHSRCGPPPPSAILSSHANLQPYLYDADGLYYYMTNHRSAQRLTFSLSPAPLPVINWAIVWIFARRLSKLLLPLPKPLLSWLIVPELPPRSPWCPQSCSERMRVVAAALFARLKEHHRMRETNEK